MDDATFALGLTKALGIPGYPLGGAGGLPQIAVCAWAFVPAAEQANITLWLSLKIDETLAQRRQPQNRPRAGRPILIFEPPKRQHDPLGYAIIRDGILNKKVTIGLLRHHSSREEIASVLAKTAHWNQVYQDTLRETLQVMFNTAQANGLLRPQTAPPRIVDGAVLTRLSHQCRHLWATGYKELEPADLGRQPVPLTPGSFGWNRARALKFLPEKDRAVDRMVKKWDSPSVGTHSSPTRTVGGLHRNLANIPRVDRVKTLVEVAMRYSNEEAMPAIDVADSERGGNEGSTRQPSTWSPATLSCIAPPGVLGKAAFAAVIENTRDKLSEPGAAVVAFTAACGLRIQSVSPSDLEDYPTGCIVSTPVCNPADGYDVDLESNEPSGARFSTVIPRQIGAEIKRHLQMIAPRELEAKANDFLKSFRFCRSTYATFRTAVKQCVPVWYHVPAIQFHIAGDLEAMGVQPWRHYQNWNVAHFSKAIAAYLRANFDPAFTHPEKSLPSCGSPFTPKPAVVCGLFEEFRRIINDATPAGTLEEQIQRVNFIGACSRYAESLLTFSRGQNDFLPLAVRGRKDKLAAVENSRIIVEKGFKRMIHFPPVLISIMERVARWQRLALEVIKTAGGIVTGTQRQNQAYGILTADKSMAGVTQLRLEDPSRSSVVTSVDAYQEGRFPALDPKWPRHFANLHLRVAGFPELDVLAAMDHFLDRRKGPLSPDAIHLGLSLKTISRMANCVANVSGLSV